MSHDSWYSCAQDYHTLGIESMQKGQVRIIAGKWRGRRLDVLAINGLRPTPDRVRETLFNWLTPCIQGSHCLDLFAGTGVLGFEALSRGADYVVMVDQSTEVVSLLKKELAGFSADNAAIYCAKVPNQLQTTDRPFDIVFLDPPYQAGLLLPCCHYLEENHYLSSQAYIYLEAQQRVRENELPIHWRLLKSGKAGNVFYHLAYREKP